MLNFGFVTEFDIVQNVLNIKSIAIGLDNINTILRTGSYPLQWKNPKVLALPKSSNEFSPISILPFMSKVFESILHEEICGFLSKNNILTQFQSGYRPAHNCVSALIKVSGDIRSELDKNNITYYSPRLCFKSSILFFVH